MIDTSLTKQFSARLRVAMLKAGLDSQRSASGADIHELSKITGCSLQICRKYIQGKVMPGLSKLIDIATALQVTPGWLVFGDVNNSQKESNENVIIRKEALEYIFMKIAGLTTNKNMSENFSVIMLELVNTIASINGTEAQNKQIIDLILVSPK